MTLWVIVQIPLALLCVVLPYAAQARESLKPPMNTPSLGTFAILMMAGFYFAASGLINGSIVGWRLDWPWYGWAGLGLAAGAVGAGGSVWVLYAMAVRGGVGLTVAGGLILSAALGANLVGPMMV